MSSNSPGSPSPYGSKYSPYQDQTSYDKIYKKAAPVSRTQEGERLAREAWEYGLVGIFTLGLLFGPWAIYKAYKATRLRVSAIVGFIMGSMAIMANLAVIYYIVFLFSI